jgi:NitT/TauT family transport system ATP-binding protein
VEIAAQNGNAAPPPDEAAFIRYAQVTKAYFDIRRRERIDALAEVTLDIPQGQFLVILGPSGCGKTTLLNILAGFEKATTGEVLLEGRRIVAPGPDRGVVFQEYALFPWLTLRQNVEYGLRESGQPRDERRNTAQRFIEMVGLTGFEQRYPHELSGGMRQRSALARVLANKPKVLLMDEPFAAVDALTRALLQKELSRIWSETGTTVVFVTHSVEEAALLGDRVIVMGRRPGKIEADIAVPLDRPRDATSAEFNDYRRDIEQKLLGASLAEAAA